MPLPWALSILVAVLASVTLRLVVRRLPLEPRPATTPRVVGSLVVGLAGLAAHCGAMFYRDLSRSIPGSDGYLFAVNGMGIGSMVLYVLPAVLVVAALRAAPTWADGAVAVALVLVGITMYDGGPLTAHLASILVAVVAIATTTAVFGPGRADPSAASQ